MKYNTLQQDDYHRQLINVRDSLNKFGRPVFYSDELKYYIEALEQFVIAYKLKGAWSY